MPATRNKPQSIKRMLLNPNLPMKRRVQMLEQLVGHGGEESRTLLEEILQEIIANKGETVYAEKIEELNQIIQAVKEGPMRIGTFVGVQQPVGPLCQAKVRLEDGTTVFPAVPEPGVAGELQRGDDVLLDAQARALVSRMPLEDGTGEEAQLERRIGTNQVEISVRGEDRYVFDASQTLIEALDRGEVDPGARLLVCARRRVAFKALPREDGLAQYRFLDRTPVPDVIVERDIGAPSPYIEELVRLVSVEMTEPELRRRYGLRRCAMKLLTGISGSGKTYSLLALRRRIYEQMSRITGVPIQDLPPRMFRFTPASVLSKWFGETEKNIARFFSEVEEVAGKKFEGPDGRKHTLPVMAVLEEIDGLARSRGHEALYDRILSTLLEMLDPTREELKDKLILFIGTTNVAHQIDMAFLRRIGGTIERFGRLGRTSFMAVLQKHLHRLPLAAEEGCTRDEQLTGTVSQVTSWLYSPNGQDPGQVALAFIGSSAPEIRYRRDFLTAGLVDRTVQQAASLACEAEIQGCSLPGVTAEALQACFDQQIRAVVDQLRVENIDQYLELPQGVRVQSVQVIEQPPVLPLALLRAA